jgi:hypothetical protein
MLLGQAHHVRLDLGVVDLQVERNQHLACLPMLHEREDRIQHGHTLAAECWIEPAAGIELLQVGPSHVSDLAGAVRRALDVVIMETDKVPVLGPPHVQLETEPQIDAGPERG